ncbi:hypothetical protein ACKWTF_001283 [Chironomus riparius]
MQKFLKVDQIFELIQNCNQYGHGLIRTYVGRGKKENIEMLWTQTENFFESKENFIEFLTEPDSYKKNLLHSAVVWKIDFQEIFWGLILKTFDNLQDLKAFILQRDEWGKSFLHYLVEHNKNPNVFEFIFKKIKDNFNENEHKEILTSNGCKEMSLLQTAMWRSDVIQIHHLLWKVYQDSFTLNDEFLSVIRKFDEKNKNIFGTAAKHSSLEVFKLLIDNVEKFAGHDEMIELLSNMSTQNQSILHIAAQHNESFKVHQSLWNLLRKYFKDNRILDFVKIIEEIDVNGRDYYLNAMKFNTPKVVDFIRNEVKVLMKECEQIQNKLDV